MTEWAGPWNGRGTMTSETNLFLLAVPATACLAWLPRTSSLVIWGSLRRSWQRAGTGLDSGLSQLSSGQWSGEGWVPWSLHVYTSDIHLHRMTEAHDHVCRLAGASYALYSLVLRVLRYILTMQVTSVLQEKLENVLHKYQKRNSSKSICWDSTLAGNL